MRKSTTKSNKKKPSDTTNIIKFRKKKIAYLLTLFPPLHLLATYSLIASTYVSDFIILSEETKDKDQFLLRYG